MASVQERLQLKRMALDKWSTREKMCLASAVSCSGDQNWMSVSRSLKLLCNESRPADWYSQKSCAVQFGDLLENVDTPKRKRTTSERENSYAAETPTESILRKFTAERISELKDSIQIDQEGFAKLREEIILLQTNKMSDGDILEMWNTVLEEENKKVAEQAKYAQWLKEREDRKLELQRAWKPQSAAQKPVLQQLKLTPTTQSDDMDIDETCSAQPLATSPLLSSLLKSSSPAPTWVTTSSSVRVTAPTITNLLTGGTMSAPSNPNSQHNNLQSKPLTGPNPPDSGHTNANALPSPSQAAPTLSMLLESIKTSGKEEAAIPSAEAVPNAATTLPDKSLEVIEEADGCESPNKELLEAFGELPDDLEEILTNNNEIILNPELLEGVESLMEEGDEELAEDVDMNTGNSADKSEHLESNVPGELRPKFTEGKDNAEIISSDDSNDNTNLQTLKEQVSKTEIKINEMEADQVDENSEDVDANEKEADEEAQEHFDECLNDQEDDLVEEKTGPPKSSNSESSDVIIIQTDDDSSEEKTFQATTAQVIKDEATTDGSMMDEKADDNSSDVQDMKKVESNISSKNDDDSKDALEEYHLDQATITIVDTDEDSCATETVQEDLKHDAFQKGCEEKEGDEHSKTTLAIRKLRESCRDRSESPLVEEEPSDSAGKVRRRYSSTPNIDSVPSSPASADEIDMRAWKKTALFVYNKLTSSKNASIFLRTISDDRFKECVLRHLDFPTIKRYIENGTIRNTVELQRDLMHMCRNVTMYFDDTTSHYIMARDMLAECVQAMESIEHKKDKECIIREREKEKTGITSVTPSSTSSTLKIRGGSRKSLRLP